ncbi:MAG: tRNA (adenosine(37)-N6)-threonylcarbamoyltransferase complex dimerization subunit type 1 TsaB [Bowdeniella nasicola]|nr:tRNA (adenosine(37)-N6)-threonylcarbamoyltransferase complex dimerization subunit type 1 TsaB [Bowdeniella nasicola]
MTRYLCLDTSAGTSVAVVEDATTVAHATSADRYGHAENLAPLVQRLLADQRPDVVVVGTGPAPYTGLRVGIMTARTLAFAYDIPVWGVSVLDVLARQAFDTFPTTAQVCAVSDARRREVYAAVYEADGADNVHRVRGPLVTAPAQVPDAELYAGQVDLLPVQDAVLPLTVDPAVLARLGRARHAVGAELPTEPLYLREPDIHRGARA